MKGNYRIARVKTELDHYLAEESDLCRRLEQFENKIDRGVLTKAALTNVEKCSDYTERLKNHRSYIEKLFEVRSKQFRESMSHLGSHQSRHSLL